MIRTPLKIILIVALFGGVAGGGSYLLLSSKLNQAKHENPPERPLDQLFGWQYPVTMFPDVGPEGDQVAYSSIRDPGGIPQGLPVRLKVPVINVNSAIEDALITPDGRMDVPYGSRNVAWFALGPYPGRVGSAVIGGHFGINDGVKFVFYDLDKLVVGDKIYIEDDKGATLTFQVRRIELFERNADATTVFTSNDGLAHLNLITCEGIWNQVNGTYPLRRVIFTDAISAEGAAPAPTITTTTFSRTLSIGMRGTDVAALQTLLVEKGFLTMPPRVSKGYFGTLTHAAVAKYQTSVGLPSTGVFNSLTKAKLVSQQPATTIKPTLPSTAVAPPSTSSRIAEVMKVLTQFIKNLYASPVDALITSALIVAIAYLALKIIRNVKKQN